VPRHGGQGESTLPKRTVKPASSTSSGRSTTAANLQLRVPEVQSKGMIRHVVVHEGERMLIDRQTLAQLTGRSEHTIRARCPIERHERGKALYDAMRCEEILNRIPTRTRRDSAA